MKRLARILFFLGVLLWLTSLGTCHFGTQHAIDQIPPDVRAQMPDTDWVGIEWIERGMVILIAAYTLVGAAAALTLTQELRKRRRTLG
jgi:hypothetical protein